MDPLRALLAHMVQSQQSWIRGEHIIRAYFDCDKRLLASLMKCEVGRAALSDEPEAPPDEAPPPPQDDLGAIPVAPPYAPNAVKKEPVSSQTVFEILASPKNESKTLSVAKKTLSIAGNAQLGQHLASMLGFIRNAVAFSGGPSTSDTEDGDGADSGSDDFEYEIIDNKGPPVAPKPENKATQSAKTQTGGVDLKNIISNQIQVTRPVSSTSVKQQIEEAKSAFERFDTFDYAKRVKFENGIFGVDVNEIVIGPFSGGIYLERDDATGLEYFLVELGKQEYIIAGNVTHVGGEDVDYTHDKQANYKFLVKDRPINAETIRNTAFSMFETFKGSADRTQPYALIKTEQQMNFYSQSRMNVKFRHFFLLGYDQKQDIYYYIAWGQNVTKSRSDYVATKTKINGESILSSEAIEKYKDPSATYYDELLINIVAPTRKPTNARLRILFRCY